MTLNEFSDSSKNLIISDFIGSKEIITRLHELGLYRGMELRIFFKQIFSGPIVIQTPHQLIALRKEEAQCIVIS